MTYPIATLPPTTERLTTLTARPYVARFAALGTCRVDVFPLMGFVTTIELRPLPGVRPQTPPVVLRTPAECDALLAEMEKDVQP